MIFIQFHCYTKYHSFGTLTFQIHGLFSLNSEISCFNKKKKFKGHLTLIVTRIPPPPKKKEREKEREREEDTMISVVLQHSKNYLGKVFEAFCKILLLGSIESIKITKIKFQYQLLKKHGLPQISKVCHVLWEQLVKIYLFPSISPKVH